MAVHVVDMTSSSWESAVGIFTGSVLQCFTLRNVLTIQKSAWLTAATLSEGDVSCFSEYMEMWIQSARIEGLGVWLSGALRSQVSLLSLEHLNRQLAACGFSLHQDSDGGFIFRVSYTGCFIQQQHSFHVLTLNLGRSRFGGRPQRYVMKCPVVSLVPNSQHIQCDPEYIQVTRQLPRDSWNNELQWSLSLSDQLIVALADASLVQMTVDVSGPDVTVQGRRREVLSPVEVMEDEGDFLSLKLVSGHYAYSLEATCPKVTASTSEDTVLHVFKQRVGLTRRGSHDDDALTLRNVSVNQTDDFTVTETRDFVTLTIPTDQILQTKACTDSRHLWQPFYRLDVVLTFKETNHKMHWSTENTLPCTIPSTHNVAYENLTTEQPSLDRSSIPEGKPNESGLIRQTISDFSMVNSSHAQTEGSSFNFLPDEMSNTQTGNLSSMFDSDTFPPFNDTDLILKTQP